MGAIGCGTVVIFCRFQPETSPQFNHLSEENQNFSWSKRDEHIYSPENKHDNGNNNNQSKSEDISPINN